MKEKYVAYVGTYTHGSSIGIHLYDVNVEEGTLCERKVIPVNNSSHLAKSLNGKYLYSIADEGVAVFAIEPDGDLTFINKVDIDGMRGCHLSTDEEGKYLFVAGYHDGKVTVVHTHRDGRLGSVLDGVFHKGLGSVGERNFRPHVSCVRPTPDNKYPHAEMSLSCPRLRPIINNDKINPLDVHETQLCQILCAYRIFLPFVGITVSSRESAQFRDGIVKIAATKVSAGVSTGIGDHESKYSGKETDGEQGDEQFEINDGRSLDRVYADIAAEGLQPVLNDYLYV